MAIKKKTESAEVSAAETVEKKKPLTKKAAAKEEKKEPKATARAKAKKVTTVEAEAEKAVPNGTEAETEIENEGTVIKKTESETGGVVLQVFEAEGNLTDEQMENSTEIREEDVLNTEEVAENDEDELTLSGRQVTTKGAAAHKMGNVGFSMSENFARVKNLLRNHNICDAVVAAVIKGGEDNKFHTDSVVVNYLNFPVYIPIDDFLTPDESTRILEVSNSAKMRLPNYDKARFEREEKLKLAKKTIGARIMFMFTKASTSIDFNNKIITGEYKRSYLITGSRNAAMRVLQHRHFFAPSAQKNPIVAGDIVECHVLRTYRDKVAVSCCGINVMMHRSELCATRWCSPLEDFLPGMTFNAVVDEINVDPKVKTVKLRLSRLLLEEDVVDFYLQQVNPNTPNSFIGKIAYIAMDEFNAPKFYGINLEAFNVRALVAVKRNNYQNMRVGDQVVFHCDDINNERKILVGSCEPLSINDRNNW